MMFLKFRICFTLNDMWTLGLEHFRKWETAMTSFLGDDATNSGASEMITKGETDQRGKTG